MRINIPKNSLDVNGKKKEFLSLFVIVSLLVFSPGSAIAASTNDGSSNPSFISGSLQHITNGVNVLRGGVSNIYDGLSHVGGVVTGLHASVISSGGDMLQQGINGVGYVGKNTYGALSEFSSTSVELSANVWKKGGEGIYQVGEGTLGLASQGASVIGSFGKFTHRVFCDAAGLIGLNPCEEEMEVETEPQPFKPEDIVDADVILENRKRGAVTSEQEVPTAPTTEGPTPTYSPIITSGITQAQLERRLAEFRATLVLPEPVIIKKYSGGGYDNRYDRAIEGSVSGGTTDFDGSTLTLSGAADFNGTANFDGEITVTGDAGTSGQVLTSAGASSAPTWETVAAGVTELSDLSDVNTSTTTNRNVLVADGIDWESRALTEADISDLGSYITDLSSFTTNNLADSLNKRYVTDAQLVVIGNTSGTNTGDQSSVVGITGTKAQFNTALTDGTFAYATGAFHDGFSDFVANEHIDWTNATSNILTTGSITGSNLSGTNTGDNSVNTLYSGLVTNATHTGEVTGSGALTLDKTAISNRSDVAITASDTIIYGDATDSNNLKKDTVQGIIDLVAAGSVELSDLSDVNTSTTTNRNVLVADGTDWESRALTEADISNLGSYLTATSLNSLSTVRVGNGNTATGTNASAFGRSNIASGTQSYAAGYSNSIAAWNDYSVAVGWDNTLAQSGTWSGYGSDRNTAIGIGNTASGSSYYGISNNIAIGNGNTATASSYYGGSAVAIGLNNSVSGYYASAFGGYNIIPATTTSGYELFGATAFGSWNTSSGYYSAAFGSWNTSSGDYSAAFGTAPGYVRSGGNQATGDYSGIFGVGPNIASANYSFVVGHGITNATANSVKIGTDDAIFTIQDTGVGTAQYHLTNLGNGTLTIASGVLTTSSDTRLKNVNGSFDDGLEEILGLEPITYTWKNPDMNIPGSMDAGFSAQNVRDFIPLAVSEGNDGYLSLSDRPILAASVNAIKEVYESLELHKEENTEFFTGLELDLEDLTNDVENNQSLLASVVETIGEISEYFTDSILNITAAVIDTITSNKIQTEEICVGDICLTEGALQQLLEGQDIEVDEPEVVADPVDDISDDDTDTPDEDPADDGTDTTDGGGTTSGDVADDTTTDDDTDTTGDDTTPDAGTDTPDETVIDPVNDTPDEIVDTPEEPEEEVVEDEPEPGVVEEVPEPEPEPEPVE